MPAWLPPGGSPQERALAYVAAASAGPPLDAAARVTLNFHPDRHVGGVPVLEALALSGVYRSQFETGTSNGGLTAYPGGARWLWESRMFGAAYDAVAPPQRPKYGGLNYRNQASGAAPRFGSAHLRLRTELLVRCTFCYPDSVFDPVDFGVHDRMGLLAMAMDKGIDLLDDYVEAHVHGPVRLCDDIEALVLDPCYKETEIEAQARRLPCALEWHPGFRVAADTLRSYPEYRGQQYVDLGARLARDGYLDPACIGAAAASGQYDQQDLKKVWHYLARYGDLSLQTG